MYESAFLSSELRRTQKIRIVISWASESLHEKSVEQTNCLGCSRGARVKGGGGSE